MSKLEAKADLEKQAIDLLARSRISLIRGRNAPCVFFGTLAMRLSPIIDWSIDTAATDGKRLYLNPEFWISLSDKERVGVVCHEILHCSNKHHTRRGNRDPELWNIACDLAINPIVLAAKMTLPKWVLLPGKQGLPDGKSAEWYYSKMQEDASKRPQGGSQDPGRCGGVIDAGHDKSELDRSEQEWTRATGQAAGQAKGRGDMPGILAANISATLKPKVDYWSILRHLMTQNDRSDYSWSRANRRHVHNGIYLPALWSQKIGKIVVAYDTSGSCWEQSILDRFAAEIDGIRQIMPSQIVLLYHDTKIQGEPETIEADEPFQIKPCGGGGTSHRQVFDWIEKNVEDAEAIICLTDLCTVFPDRHPDVPTIWISLENREAPFGDVIWLENTEGAAGQ